MPRWPGRAVAAALGVVLTVGAASPAAAENATERIRGFFANVNRVLADPSYEDRHAERLAALRAMVVEIVDFSHAAETALGVEWRARTRGEREEFTRLFTDLLQTSVFAMVGGRARIDNGLTVSYVGELNDGDGVTVATSVLTRSGSEMAVGYRMARRDGRWVVRDVVVDGVSLVDNYRAQFQKVIQRSSYAGLVGEMRTRIAELGRPTDAVASTPSAPAAYSAATPAPREPTAATATAEPAQAPPAALGVPPVPVRAAMAPPAADTPRVASSRGATDVVAPPSSLAGTRSVAPPAASGDTPPMQTARVNPVRVAPVASRAPATTARVETSRAERGAAVWVQVGAFRELERAMGVVTALRDQSVSMLTAPGEPLVRVVVGPFADRAAATAKLRELRRRGYEAFIAGASK